MPPDTLTPTTTLSAPTPETPLAIDDPAADAAPLARELAQRKEEAA